MDASNLLFNIHNLHPLHLFALVQLPVIAQRCPLPSGSLLFADDWLSSHTIEDVTALGSEALEVGGYIGSREIGCRGAEIGFLALLLPTRVEEFDCKNSSVFVRIYSSKMMKLENDQGPTEYSKPYFSCDDPARRMEPAACSLDIMPSANSASLLGHVERNHS